MCIRDSDDPAYQAYGITPTKKGVDADDEFLVHGLVPGFRKRTADLPKIGSSSIIPSDRLSEFNMIGKTSKPYLQALPTQFVKNRKGFNDTLRDGKATAADFRPVQGSDMVSLLVFLKDQGMPPRGAKLVAQNAAEVLNYKIANHKGPITEAVFGNMINTASTRAIRSGFMPMMRPVTNEFGYDTHTRHRGLEPMPFQMGVTKLPGCLLYTSPSPRDRQKTRMPSSA